MTSMITAVSAWALLALPLSALIGRTIRRADVTDEAPFSTDGVERYLRKQASAPQG